MGSHWVEVDVCDGVVFLDELRIEKTAPVFLLGRGFGGKHRISDLLNSLSAGRHGAVVRSD